jgi:starch synthase (maltosyl-transferring)
MEPLGKLQPDGRNRVVVEGVRPEIDSGRFPIKRVLGEEVVVEADVFVDGHDELSCRILYRHTSDRDWRLSPMTSLGNDRWRGKFRVSELGQYEYTVEGWIDRFGTWRRDLMKRISAGQDIAVECLIGAALLEESADRAAGSDRTRLLSWASMLRKVRERVPDIGLEAEVTGVVQKYPVRNFPRRYDKQLRLVVDRERARYSAWYELFPRSCAPQPGQHGTLRDCEGWLARIAAMGFDVLYLPPIHPIGITHRKGRNNSVTADANDVGSPWAIGSDDGGHRAIHPALGTLEDFDHLLAAAKVHGIEIALDLALQCSPDHPYVREHPEWFRKRPDGTIQYAENPPKKYQDILPIDFETEQWQSLWEELEQILLFWIGRGVRIFRVDNPHTKALSFWEWVIEKIKGQYPEVLFLAEAFTRPKLMYRLAKLGFSQSYTYFAWRNTKDELTGYFRELIRTEVREYFRPNLWPNTPDILTEYLQTGGPAAFMVRLILAATLAASYGIYGPAFELCENTPREPGSEEYLESEKYELKHWNVDTAWSLKDLIARMNRIRRDNAALQSDRSLLFHDTDNPALICYSKASEDLSNVIIVVVNLDAFHRQAGWINLDIGVLGLDTSRTFQAHDLLGDGRYFWQGARNYVELTPGSLPAHVMRVRKWVRTEKDFDYYF